MSGIVGAPDDSGPITTGGGSTDYPSTYYYADTNFTAKTVSAAADRYKITTPAAIQIDVGGASLELEASTTIDLSSATTWDTADPTDYTTAGNRAGLDFYIYACQPVSGRVPTFKVSAASTVPEGYDADTSRKVGGFHCLCVAAGTISSHTLTGYLAGDILPASVWDLKKRPHSNPEGMTYLQAYDVWVDIYPQSSTGATTASVYNATVQATRIWNDHVDDGAAVKKRLLTDAEYQAAATGSNEKTNINGGARVATVGGHSDSASRRMISNIGCEDCCGYLRHWLADQSMKWDFVTSWGWYALAGDKGSLYNGNTTTGGGDVKLCAGGIYSDSTAAGSRNRNLALPRWTASADTTARFCSRNISK